MKARSILRSRKAWVLFLRARLAQQRISVPTGRREELVWIYQSCLADNLVRDSAVKALAKVFGEPGIPTVLLKGMALIQLVFATGERSMSDVDILVPPSSWREACDLVVRAGYQKNSAGKRRHTLNHDYVRSFTSPGGMVVEIERFVCEETIFSVDYEGPEGVFARASRLDSGVPGACDLFLTLAAHATKHTFELPLRSYVDGIVLMRRHNLPIGSLRVRAGEWRMEKAFRAWMRPLRTLQVTEEVPASEPRPMTSSAAERWTRFVWSRTCHDRPWQRFVRMAWLTDGGVAWARLVAARTLLRAVEAVQFQEWIYGRHRDDAKAANRT